MQELEAWELQESLECQLFIFKNRGLLVRISVFLIGKH